MTVPNPENTRRPTKYSKSHTQLQLGIILYYSLDINASFRASYNASYVVRQITWLSMATGRPLMSKSGGIKAVATLEDSSSQLAYFHKEYKNQQCLKPAVYHVAITVQNVARSTAEQAPPPHYAKSSAIV